MMAVADDARRRNGSPINFENFRAEILPSECIRYPAEYQSGNLNQPGPSGDIELAVI